MEQPGSGAALRTRRFILWALLAAEVAVALLVVVLVRHRRDPVIELPLEHPVAYAWMAITVAAALGAYLLARGRAGVPRYRAAIAVGLTHLAALAGMGGFYLLKIWPMLIIGGLAALAGLALAYPTAAPAAPGAPLADAPLATAAAEDATPRPH